MEKETIEKFKKEDLVLCEKYNLCVTSCGCCNDRIERNYGIQDDLEYYGDEAKGDMQSAEDGW